jgi:signal transduction histidine kinase
MRRSLLISTTLIALAGVLVLGLPLGIVGARLIRTEATSRLEREADFAAAALGPQLRHDRPVTPAQLAALARPGHEVIVARDGAVTRGGTPIERHRIVVRSASAKGATVAVVAPAHEVDEKVGGTWLLIALLALGGVAAAVGLGLLQARRLARPLEQLAIASERLGAGDFAGARAPHHGLPEADAVASALSRASARIAQLVAREREFSANVSHQLRTPLTALRLRLEELDRPGTAPDARAEAAAALDQVDRLEATVDGLLALARDGRAGRLERVELARLVVAHAEAWQPLFGAERRALELSVDAPVAARADPATVGQALDVLLDNALRHGDGTARVRLAERGPATILTVSDEGPGVPRGDEERIFERHVSGAGGDGIGLSLARALVDAGGGRLVLARPSPPVFELLLPRDGDGAGAT